jgi:endonuclease/exonuclease/phosphatase family metal-dependent hydrolase
VVKAPAPLGEVDVYVTHLTGGGEATRQAQAADVVQKIKDRDSGRPTLLIGDMTDPADSATYKVFRDAGFTDAAGEQDLPTCCRKSVVGDQPPATTRPDSILAKGFGKGVDQLFAQDPIAQPDMTKLYASDHNGLFAVFTLGP